jgi:hypothetical protein
MRGLVVDLAYVGNRGVWWTAPVLSTESYNTLQPSDLAKYGLDIHNSSDLALLTTAITSPLVQARFPNLKIVNTPGGLPTVPSVYPGFPATQVLMQALRPYPQFYGVPPFLGPPLGDTWYDSAQLKVTRRFSHGLDFQYNFTYQREFALGVNSDTSYLTPNPTPINDVYNRSANKQLSAFERPLVSIFSVSYRTPKVPGDGTAMRVLGKLTKDWTIGAVLRYQSGALLAVSKSNNNFFNQLGRGVAPVANNPAVWGGAVTYQNLTGQPLFTVDPNCHCFDPTKQLVLNSAAWTDAAAGTFGTAPAYQEGYRWQRQPGESMSFGRIFPLAREGKVNLNVRFEFQNIFNRVFYSAPSTTNPQSATFFNNNFANGKPGALSTGFGFVNSLNGFGTQPRTGQFVARITF